MRASFVASLLFATAAYAAMTITTPAINQCKDATFNIAGATGDVQLTILPSDKPCDHDGLVIKGGFANGDATLHNINLAAGTSVVVVADDAAGNEAWSATIIVGGSAADCAASPASTTTTRAGTTAGGSAQRTSATAPVNAASPTDAPTSGATSLKTSWGFGAFVALSALIFTA